MKYDKDHLALAIRSDKFRLYGTIYMDTIIFLARYDSNSKEGFPEMIGNDIRWFKPKWEVCNFHKNIIKWINRNYHTNFKLWNFIDTRFKKLTIFKTLITRR